MYNDLDYRLYYSTSSRWVHIKLKSFFFGHLFADCVSLNINVGKIPYTVCQCYVL